MVTSPRSGTTSASINELMHRNGTLQPRQHAGSTGQKQAPAGP
jgi:hypothetical protein